MVLSLLVWLCCAANQMTRTVKLKAYVEDDRVVALRGPGPLLKRVGQLSLDHLQSFLTRQTTAAAVRVPVFRLPYRVTALPKVAVPAPLVGRPASPSGVEPISFAVSLSAACPVWVQVFWGVEQHALESLLHSGINGLQLHRATAPTGGVMVGGSAPKSGMSGSSPMERMAVSCDGDRRASPASPNVPYESFKEMESPVSSLSPSTSGQLSPSTLGDDESKNVGPGDDTYDMFLSGECLARDAPRLYVVVACAIAAVGSGVVVDVLAACTVLRPQLTRTTLPSWRRAASRKWS